MNSSITRDVNVNFSDGSTRMALIISVPERRPITNYARVRNYRGSRGAIDRLDRGAEERAGRDSRAPINGGYEARNYVVFNI